jgi:hypothetical protein
MPARSKKQFRLMAAAAHNPAFAKKVGVPQKVAKEYTAASKGTYGKLPEQKNVSRKGTAGSRRTD